jgi:hypothetical protein
MLMMQILSYARGDKPAGFMVPIPQYPLYDATILEMESEKVFIYKA